MFFLIYPVKTELNKEAIIRLGERIRILRLKQNTTQSQLAFEANIPQNQLGRIERGEINTTINTLFSISAALEVDIKELFN